MKEKLEELRKQKKRLRNEYDAVSMEIIQIENQLRTENADLYMNKWFYVKDSNWNVFDEEYSEYTFVFITEVLVGVHSKPYLSGIRIDTDTNYMMKEFSFRRIEALTLEEIQEYTELPEHETQQLSGLVKNMLRELFIPSPCLKEELKDLFK